MVRPVVVKVWNATWERRLLIQNACQFFAKILKGFRRKRVYLDITLVKGLKHKEKCRAFVKQFSPHKFSITMDRDLGPVAAMSCLAHELIHVNQWLSGKMEDLNTHRGKVRWGSRVFYAGKLPYRKHPWEQQAYKYDTALGNRFMEFWGRGE